MSKRNRVHAQWHHENRSWLIFHEGDGIRAERIDLKKLGVHKDELTFAAFSDEIEELIQDLRESRAEAQLLERKLRRERRRRSRRLHRLICALAEQDMKFGEIALICDVQAEDVADILEMNRFGGLGFGELIYRKREKDEPAISIDLD